MNKRYFSLSLTILLGLILLFVPTPSHAAKTFHVKPSPNVDQRKWTYKDNIFDAGNETYIFDKYEVRNSINKNKKVLVLYCNITNNNSQKEMDPSNIYIVMHAYQKNKNSKVQLLPGMVALDDQGNDPLQKYTDNLNNSLLPTKKVRAAICFEFNNDNPITVTFQNPDFKVIGKKTYQVKGKKVVGAKSDVESSKNTANNEINMQNIAKSQAGSIIKEDSKNGNNSSIDPMNYHGSLTDFVNAYGVSPARYKSMHGMSTLEALQSTDNNLKTSGELQSQYWMEGRYSNPQRASNNSTDSNISTNSGSRVTYPAASTTAVPIYENSIPANNQSTGNYSTTKVVEVPSE